MYAEYRNFHSLILNLLGVRRFLTHAVRHSRVIKQYLIQELLISS